MGLQSFSPEDLVYLTGGNDTVRSMPVTVFSFTLQATSSSVDVCPPDQFSGPFISYVREDDDYESVVARFGLITGEPENEWKNYRLAVVDKNIPYFVPRGEGGAATSESATSAQGQGLSSAAATTDDNGNHTTTSAASAATHTETDPTPTQMQQQQSATTKNHPKKEAQHVPTVWEKLIESYDYDTSNNHKLNESKLSLTM